MVWIIKWILRQIVEYNTWIQCLKTNTLHYVFLKESINLMMHYSFICSYPCMFACYVYLFDYNYLMSFFYPSHLLFLEVQIYSDRHTQGQTELFHSTLKLFRPKSFASPLVVLILPGFVHNSHVFSVCCISLPLNLQKVELVHDQLYWDYLNDSAHRGEHRKLLCTSAFMLLLLSSAKSSVNVSLSVPAAAEHTQIITKPALGLTDEVAYYCCFLFLSFSFFHASIILVKALVVVKLKRHLHLVLNH